MSCTNNSYSTLSQTYSAVGNVKGHLKIVQQKQEKEHYSGVGVLSIKASVRGPYYKYANPWNRQLPYYEI